MWNKAAAKTRQIALRNDSGTTNNNVCDLCYEFISDYYIGRVYGAERCLKVIKIQIHIQVSPKFKKADGFI